MTAAADNKIPEWQLICLKNIREGNPTDQGGNYWFGKFVDPNFISTENLDVPEISDNRKRKQNFDLLSMVCEKMLPLIPEREKEMLLLLYLGGMKQEEVAQILGITQEAVCYRKKRALQRLQWVKMIQDVDIVELESDLKTLYPNKIDWKVMLLMFQTTNQSLTARTLGISTFSARNRFLNSVTVLLKTKVGDSKIPEQRLLTYQKIYDIMVNGKRNGSKRTGNYMILSEKLHMWRDRKNVV